MFSTLRTRFGIPGVISVVALVFAMLGGAYAANNSSGGGKATASAKAKKGPRGPKGATGPAGPAGAQGPAGAKGDTGAAGSNGTNGSDGAKGATGATGPQGLTGATGPIGPTGPSGGGGGGGLPTTLGSGETETGAWWIVSNGSEPNVTSISFPIPLSEANAAATEVRFWQEEAGKEPAECPGNTLEPKADPGFLCIYYSKAKAPSFVPIPDVNTPEYSGEEEESVGPSGAILHFGFQIGTPGQNWFGGSFAITAPAP